MNKNVLVVEDDPDIQQLLKINLGRANWNVHIAESGEAALLRASDCHPDLILLDLLLPGIGGLALCQQFRSYPRTCEVPIIIVSALSGAEDIVKGLEFGADDYVTKPFDLSILHARIKAVIRRRGTPLPRREEDVILIHDLLVDSARHLVKVGNESVEITPTEFCVLQLLAGSPGRVFTRQQIIDAAHEPDSGVTARSVDVQIVGLRKHLGRAGRYIETIRGIGYRFKEEIE